MQIRKVTSTLLKELKETKYSPPIEITIDSITSVELAEPR